MKTRSIFILIAFCLFISGVTFSTEKFTNLRLKFSQRNYKEAYDGFYQFIFDKNSDNNKRRVSLNFAINCLNNLNRQNEIDSLLEKFVAEFGNNWQNLSSASKQYQNIQHYGYMIAGKFERGHHRGGGEYVNAQERDRAMAMKLFDKAARISINDKPTDGLAEMLLQYAKFLQYNRNYGNSWRLQYLTSFDELPDYESGYYGNRSLTSGAPVDENGNPIFYKIPETYESAKNDGERWRWLLTQAMKIATHKKGEALWLYAEFLKSQFGVQTVRNQLFSRTPNTENPGIFSLHTLSENETIARLATGVKRLQLPDEFNHIKIYQQIIDSGSSGYKYSSISSLGNIFENRLQYDKALSYWQKYLAHNKRHAENKISQITKAWGKFEPLKTQPKDSGAEVQYCFRNGTEVQFEAHKLDVKLLLADVKGYLKSTPGRLDWDKLNISDIGQRIVYKEETKYIKEKVADWRLSLTPREHHFDKRITVATPLQKAGAYLLTAKINGGNTSRIIIWINDTVIIKKAINGAMYYYVADAVTGAPIEKANLEFFGYDQDRINRTNKYIIKIENFSEYTDANGQYIATQGHVDRGYRWLITATTPEGRFAYHGFEGIWYNNKNLSQLRHIKPFCITDRPVYRPEQKMNFNIWVRRAEYGLEEKSFYANQDFTVIINDPKGQKIFEKPFTTDAFGGISSEYNIPTDATLGIYNISIIGGPFKYGRHAGNFRVEEYKKPEYEVKVEAPEKPVMLGEKITAKIKAKYYFGAPVTDAKVIYKVLRYEKDNRWFPVFEWDWLFGNGYWWFVYDYDWYPGWRNWGCRMPYFSWWPRQHTPPEVILSQETKVDENGEVKIEIDTSLTKELHGDTDHRYEITAEVRDKSRRTIIGKGEILVARKPYQVYIWLDRGYYNTGDTIKADFNARTISGAAVKGKGLLKLLKINYNKDGQPVEKNINEWKIDTDEAGTANMQLTASAAGQYRLSYALDDNNGHNIEGGYIFVVRGKTFDSENFHFNDIEIITDKKEYAPGEEIKLMINTEMPDSTVILFARSENGICGQPEVLRINGKSTVKTITAQGSDMPNIFIEAITVANGKLHSAIKEIHLPPQKRIINVAIETEKTKFKPGEKVKGRVKFTGLNGEPVSGAAVLAVYDKSVEYISGGSNVEDIKEFFWKWKRSHYPRTWSNLDRYFYNLLKRNEESMQGIGIFGNTVADQTLPAEQNTWGRGSRYLNVKKKNGSPMPALQRSKGDVSMMKCESVASADSDSLMEESKEMEDGAALGKGGVDSNSGTNQEVTVRKNFADTAFWKTAVTTGADGYVDIEFTMPENLGTWKFKAWGMAQGTKVGETATELITTKDLIIRMQAPRFFIEKDYVVLSANIHNYHDSAKDITAILEIDSKNIVPVKTPRIIEKDIFAKELPEDSSSMQQKITIPAGGEKRVDWWVKVKSEGEVTIRMKAIAPDDSDAMEMKFPVFVHGFEKMVPFSGVIRPEQENGIVTFDIPAERRIDSARIELRYSPTLAGAMLDALPYLAEFPYGCTEQTLNRFLTSVITQKVLQRTGISLEDLRDKITNLNAQEIGDDKERSKGWKRWDRNPVFEKGTLDRMVKDGVKKLTAMQLSDGGWGWFSGYGEYSYPHTTAVVVHGLQTARSNDVAIVPGVIARGISWLKNYQAEEIRKIKNAPTLKLPYKKYADDMDAFVYMVLADEGVNNTEMKEFLLRDKSKLSVYGLSMLGIALDKVKDIVMRDAVIKNISQYLVEDNENQTAYLNLHNNRYWWCWYGSEWETHAYYLKLLSRVDPKGTRAAGLVKYLLNNRKHSTYWNSTRDTSACIEAFAEYLAASGEDAPDMEVKIMYDGKLVKEVKINKENLFTFDNKFVIEGKEIHSGKHKIEIVKTGKGPLYFNAYATYFSLEDYITKAGLEVKVERNYYKLVRDDKNIKVAGSRGQALDQRTEKYRRIKLENLADVTSGDKVEVELVLESKNDYEYIIVEDMKPAGFEAVEVRSGYISKGLHAYMEPRDEKVCLFMYRLARGRHSISYQLQAEIPGRFSALPAKASAMYAPEIRANSNELKLIVKDEE